MEKRITFGSFRVGALFVLPQILLIFVFFYWPTAQAVRWAFTLEQPWGGGSQFVGFDNFRDTLSDPAYWNAFRRTMIFTAWTLAAVMVLGMVLALICDRQLRFYKVYRTVLLWPFAVVAPAAASAFRYVFAPEIGIFAPLARAYPGIWNPAENGTHAMIMIIVCYSWKYFAFNFIFTLAALQTIPRSLIEAAAMDGSGPLRRAWDIQLPLLAPTLFFLLVLNVTQTFQDSFAIVDVMTSGGPVDATELLVNKIYYDGTRALDFSGASAQSIILMIVMMALCVLQFKFLEKRIRYV